MYKFCLAVLLATIVSHAGAQNVLPDFSVDSLGKSLTRVSWVNPFGRELIQMNIQSSYDSIKNFRTFFSSPSPELPQNGVVDKRAYSGRMFYRIFYVITGARYYFTKSKTPSKAMPELSDKPREYTEPEVLVNSDLPSVFVVVNHDGFAEIKLPDAATKKYKLVFFDGDHKPLFTINKVTDTDLVLDKTNFLHAGLFYFELYDGVKLVEKNKIYLQKEF